MTKTYMQCYTLIEMMALGHLIHSLTQRSRMPEGILFAVTELLRNHTMTVRTSALDSM